MSSYTSATDDPYLVKVGSAKIYKRDVERALEGQPGDAASRQAALENLIRQELLLSDARAHGVAVSAVDLQKAILSIPALQENGKFSPERYKEFLANRYPSAQAFEERLSRDILLQGQLSSLFGTGFVSHGVVLRVAGMLGESREVQPLLFKPADFAAKVDTSNAALQKYYDANAKRFATPEAVKVDYVVLSQDELAKTVKVDDAEAQKYFDVHQAEFGGEQRRASHILLTVDKAAKPEQKAKIKAEADALLKEVRANPAKFAELAKAKSQDPGSADKGGDLGLFGHGVMVKPFDDVVFRMKPGQVSEVVETEFGYHIIKLDEIKPVDFASVKAAVIDKLQKQKAGSQFRAQADKLAELAYQQGDSLKAVVDTLKLEARHSDWLSRGQQAEGELLANPKALEAALSDDVLNKKHNSEVLDLGGGKLVVLRVAEHRAAAQQKLDAVKDVIRAELVARDGAKLAEQNGQAMLGALKAGKGAEQAWGQPQTVSRRNPAGLQPDDARAIFAVAGNKLPGYAGAKHANGDYAIWRVQKVIPAPQANEGELQQLSGMLSEMSSNAQLASYLDSLRQKYPVTRGKQALGDQGDPQQ